MDPQALREALLSREDGAGWVTELDHSTDRAQALRYKEQERVKVPKFPGIAQLSDYLTNLGMVLIE